MPNATKIEWITRDVALQQLDLKERRLRDYIAAGKIKLKDGMLHAGDVARLQTERAEKKAGAQVRALATIEPEVRAASKLANARTLVAAGFPGQSGNAAIAPLPDRPWLTLDQAEDYTGLPSSTLRAMIDHGRLPALDVGVRPGGRWRVRRTDLDKIEGLTREHWNFGGRAIGAGN